MTRPRLSVVPTREPERSAETHPSEDLWNVGRTATFLGMSRSWVYRASERGELPYRKLGNCLRFIPREMREWLHRQTGSVQPR